MMMSDLEANHLRATQQRAATRTALILAVLAVAVYVWVFISKM